MKIATKIAELIGTALGFITGHLFMYIVYRLSGILFTYALNTFAGFDWSWIEATTFGHWTGLLFVSVDIVKYIVVEMIKPIKAWLEDQVEEQ